MSKTRFWHVFISLYTLALGLPFLLFPDPVPALRYAPGDLIWVRVTGMCLLGYSYFNYVLSREHHVPSIRANIVNQAIATVTIGALAIGTGSTAIGVVAILILVGFVGLAMSARAELRAYAPGPVATLPSTAKWNWYVAGYTFVYGTATALLPHLILPIVGFADPVVAWTRVSGLLFYVLSVFNIVVARQQGTPPVILAILVIRIWFIANLLVFGLLGYPWFVFASAGIVAIGVVGTIITYRHERVSQS
jgi:hypothetical protein